MVYLAVFLLALAAPTQQAVQSPCPSVLVYEDTSADQPDRWYGQISFPPGSKHWLFMNIVLDNKADMLGNWLGAVTTEDNQVYRIENPELKTSREPLRFFVKHDPEDPSPPKVQIIKLEDQEICNVNKPVVEVPIQPAANNPNYRPKDRANFTDASDFRVPINYYEINEKAQCGKVTLNNPVVLVVDGAPTLEGQWPWQIALYKTQWVNHNYICGGTLVSHRHVITAAHCTTVRNSKPAQKIEENTLTVYLGKHDLVTSIVGVQIRFVEKITIFPEYDTKTYSRDLSVLQLQEPVLYTNWVQPACLWPDQLGDLSTVIDKEGSVVGWGNDGSGKLQLVKMPVVTQEACLRSKSDFFARVTSDYTFCAGSRNGSSACNGDSGGGIVFQVDGAWHLRGVVSLAPSKDNEAVCDPLHYVVFTDLAKFLPWIRQNIEPY